MDKTKYIIKRKRRNIPFPLSKKGDIPLKKIIIGILIAIIVVGVIVGAIILVNRNNKQETTELTTI